MKIKKLILTVCWCAFTAPIMAQPNSVLASGNWYKFSVATDGAYRISYDLLKSTGINPDQIDPRNIRLFSGASGMLPQGNDKPRPQDLIELAIFVSGESDGRFNREDFILFYGQGPDSYGYDLAKKIFAYQNNLFTDKNFYFLTVTSAGKRMEPRENVTGTFPLIQEFDDFAFYETEKYNLLKSGRQWFGEQFDNIKEATIRFDIPGIIDNTNINFTSHVMAQSFSNSSFKLLYNNNAILDQPILAVPNSRYAIKGRIAADTVLINTSSVRAASQISQEIKYQFTRGNIAGLSVGYLDYFLFTIKRKLAQYGDQTIFTSANSVGNATSTFEVAVSSPKLALWNITDPFNAGQQNFQLANSKLSFSAASSSLQKFILINLDKSTAPTFESQVPTQNLHGLAPTELIIVTHPDFKKEAQRLSNHRQSKSGISSTVVTTEQIYNEYAGGKQDFTAIRDFVRDQYRKPNSPLKNLLLFGRGSYDYKSRVFNNTNFVPIYESVNSLSPLETYSSDDYYGMLKDSDGDWREYPSQNSTMDIGVGRIPVKKVEEAKAVVDKIIEYEINSYVRGRWQKDILFVADDGDFNIHQSQSDQLASSMDATNPEFDITKLFLDSFNQIERNAGPFSPDAARALDLAIRKGKGIVNFTGHGSEKVWMQEQILTETMVLNWKNAPHYPLFVTATCEFGRTDDPFIICSGERILLQPKGGGIGLVTTSRPVNSSTNFTLNRAFYTAFLSKPNGSFSDLGTIFRETKNTSLSGVANRNFSLLGDPSMKLMLGSNQAIATEVKTSSGSSTLKGLSTVTVKGQIKKGSSLLANFNGELQATLFDRPTNMTTKGNENPPFSYLEASNVLFNGKASVKNGVFQFDFIMPSNISSAVAKGKLSLFAFSNTEQAIGSTTDFLIGGAEPAPPVDTTPPAIKLFLGDTTFMAGGKVGPNTKLVARLTDDSGINLSSGNPANNLIATLDGTQRFFINDYFVSDTDDFTRGLLTFPIDTLKKGKHTIALTASDNHNNIGTASLDFVVTDGTEIQIEEFSNFPNPVVTDTQFHFSHSRPGEDLETSILIYNLTGQIVHSQQYSVSESQYQVTLPSWNGEGLDGRKLGNGLYLARLFVRSLLDGSNNEQTAKLIIMN